MQCCMLYLKFLTFSLCVKFNLYASQYSKYLPCLMQSISQLSVILHCLCYVIIISYLALHCPNSAPNHSYGISQNCSNLCSLPFGRERLYTPRFIPPPPSHLGGGEGGGVTSAAGRKGGNFPEENASISIFKLPVLIFRTPAGSSQLGVGGGGAINGH